MSKPNISVESKGRRVLVLSEIRTDAGCQPRSGIVDEAVEDYRAHLSHGGDLPPVDVFYDGSEYYLADGYHRFHAHARAGLKRINAIVSQGTLREAVLYSLGANQTHGLRRSNEDKRRAVERMFGDDEWVNWSDAKIAGHIGVSQSFVRDLRPKIAPTSHKLSSDEPDRRLGRDGRMRSTSRKPKVSGVTRTPEHSQPEPEYEEPVRQVDEDTESVGAPRQRDADSAPPQDDDREGGDSVVTETLGSDSLPTERSEPGRLFNPPASGTPQSADEIEAQRRADIGLPMPVAPTPPREGMVSYWVDPADPVSVFANGLTMAMWVSQVLPPDEFARRWPENIPLPPEELNKFCDLLMDFESEFRAALRAAE
jgi:hypothetical protein